MNVVAVMDEAAEKLNEIPGLKVLPFAASSVPTLPAALISLPAKGNYSLTYGQGMDTFQLDIVVLVSKVVDRAARNALGPFISGDGESSVRNRLSARGVRWRSCDAFNVTGFALNRITMGNGQNQVKYLAVVFSADVTGGGN